MNNAKLVRCSYCNREFSASHLKQHIELAHSPSSLLSASRTVIGTTPGLTSNPIVADGMATVKTKIAKFERDGAMPIGLAQRLISDSAYWYGHPRGPARAPKHANRVSAGLYGWEIEFGANTFLVESAIRRCTKNVLAALDCVDNNGRKYASETLKAQMAKSVRGAVANFAGEEYPGFWQVHGEHMIFGTQSVNVGEFIYCYWGLAGLAKITA